MIALPSATQIWIAAGVTDLRQGFDGLSGIVQAILEASPFSGHVFVFPFFEAGGGSDQSAVVRRRRFVFVFQEAGAWPLHLAEGGKWKGIVDTSPVVDVVGGYRLTATGADQVSRSCPYEITPYIGP